MIIIESDHIVNENEQFSGQVIIERNRIKQIIREEKDYLKPDSYTIYIDAKNKTLIPGVIDDQVHFRDPGLTDKGDIHSESRAAVAGGITSYMEMPNTNPQTTTIERLLEKQKIGREKSMANFSFYFGATNDNINEILSVDPETCCGIKLFMGSSTGNMLVDKPESLEKIFKSVELPIAVHSEKEDIIRENLSWYQKRFGDYIPVQYHPQIRSRMACLKSSEIAVGLARKHNTRLHLIHISTEDELSLFSNVSSPGEKQITSEACVHHLWFDKRDYDTKGAFIRWNPAIKNEADKLALQEAVKNNLIDVVATDHAPHVYEDKLKPYLQAPSGGPLVQHALPAMLELFHRGVFSLEKVVEKMCHTPADIFRIEKRGYIRENYFADLCIVDLNQAWEVSKDNILYKCKWSPFENTRFKSSVIYTIINGEIVYEHGKFKEDFRGDLLNFSR